MGRPGHWAKWRLGVGNQARTIPAMARYPARTPVLAELAPVFTAAKWLTLSSCFVLLVAALVATLLRRRRG